MRSYARRAIAILAILAIVSLLAACAAPATSIQPEAPTDASALTSGSGARASNSASDSTSASEGKQAAPGASGQTGSSTAAWDRMLIRTSNVAMTVDDVEQTLAAIRDIAQVTESFVASSQSQYVGERMTATVTLQVPAKAFDGVIQQVRKLAVKVDSEQTASQDVTEEYVDLQSQINNLKATEASEVRLLEKATSMSDVLAVQRELTSVRGQIEQAQGRLNYLQRRSDYSTLSVRLTPVGAATDTTSTTWQPLQTISRAWKASIETVSAIVDAALAVVVFLWWLIPIVVVGVWLWRRQRRRKSPAPAPPAAPGPAAPPAAAP